MTKWHFNARINCPHCNAEGILFRPFGGQANVVEYHCKACQKWARSYLGRWMFEKEGIWHVDPEGGGIYDKNM